jgi:3-hydroxyisobutyrate dehydrogenase-like beta-hydroxyacid dehydrogenase
MHKDLYIAAPVLGNPTAAQAAKLTMFVAGDPTAIELCNKLLNSYCQKIIGLGNEHATANTLELSANYVMGVPLDLMGQVYALGEKSGINCNL